MKIDGIEMSPETWADTVVAKSRNYAPGVEIPSANLAAVRQAVEQTNKAFPMNQGRSR